MLKVGAVLFALAVPFLALRDCVQIFAYQCLQGWSLALDMWQE